MAIKPLEDRLDELSSVSQDVTDIEMTAPADPLPEPIEYTQDEQAFEPVQTAGLIDKAIKGALKKAPKKTEVPIIPKGEDSGTVGPYQVVPEATPAKAAEVEALTPAMPVEGKPPETIFNLNLIKDSDSLKQHIEAVGQAFGADKLVKISYKDVAAKAAEEGYDEAFIAKIINPAQATQADPRFAYKMMLAVVDSGKRTFDLAEKVKAAKAAGNLTPELVSEFQQAYSLEGAIVKSAKLRQADIARTLGIFSQARTTSANRGAMLEAIVNEAGGMENAFDLATKYTALDSRSARANLAEKTIGGTLKDVWFSTWINGLLSSPVTHAKNIAGNFFFGAYQIPERAVASVIGKTRNTLFKGGEEAIAMSEVHAQAVGMIQGLREGAEIAITAFKKNEPTDPFTKIEATRSGRDAFDIDFGDSETGKAMSNMFKYYGNFVTLPGRALMAEDEFFKGMGYRMELNALAARASKREYDSLIKAGVPEDQAAAKASDYMVGILTDPPADIEEAARGMARTVTFTRELESGLQGIQKFMQNPIMKMFVPFVRTPTNIAMEAMSRTPGLNLIAPRFWADYNAGGIKRDMALARVTLGTGVTASVGAFALEGKITGFGPMRQGDKEALKGNGWQEFSVVFNKSDVDPELLKKFQEITTVSVGPDKVYISYAGLEPLSTLLGISATAGEYSMMNAGEADMTELMTGAGLGFYTYLAEQPMLQGFGEINKALTSGAKDAPTLFYNIATRLGKQVGGFAIGGSPLGVHSSMVAAVERLVNPNRSNTMEALSEEEMDIASGARRGFWEALNQAKSRNPLTSDSLPPLLDPITGEVKKAGKGNLYEMFSPFRNSDGKFSPAHAVLVEYGVPQYLPPKKFSGVELTAEQYNRWIELATEGGALERNLVTLGKELSGLAASDLGAAQTILSDEVSKSYSAAKQRLIAEDPALQDAIREVEDLQKERGKYKR